MFTAHCPDEIEVAGADEPIHFCISICCGDWSGVMMAHPMGESENGALRVDFDRRLKL